VTDGPVGSGSVTGHRGEAGERPSGRPEVGFAHIGGELGLEEIGRFTDDKSSGHAALGWRHDEPSPILRIDVPVQVATHDQEIHEVTCRLFGKPEALDDHCERDTRGCGRADDVWAIGRQVVIARLFQSESNAPSQSRSRRSE